MNSRIIFLLALTIFFSCSTTKETKENENTESRSNGITKEFFENGDLKVDWNYKNNQLNGISKEYHKDGTYSEWNYENGQLIDGKSYFKNGILLQEYTFKNGKRDGLAIRYYESGEKETVWEF